MLSFVLYAPGLYPLALACSIRASADIIWRLIAESHIGKIGGKNRTGSPLPLKSPTDAKQDASHVECFG